MNSWISRRSETICVRLLRQYFRKGDDLSRVEPADVLFAAEEINGRPRAVLGWDSATVRFGALHASAARRETEGCTVPGGKVSLAEAGTAYKLSC